MDDAQAAQKFDSIAVPADPPDPTTDAQAQPENALHTGEPIDSPGEVVWLRDDDFAPVTPQLVDDRQPGPGLLESIGWLLGVLGLQLFGAAVVGSLIVVGYAVSLPPEAREELLRSLHDE